MAFIELHAPKDERFENVLGIEIALILPVVYILWPLLHGAHAGSSSSSSRKNGDVVRSEDNSFSYLLGSIAWILWAVSLALMSAGLIIGAEFFGCISLAALLTLFAQGVGGVSLLIRNSSLAYACKRRSSTTSDDFPDGDDIRREAFQRDVSNESAFVSADEWSRKDFVEGQSHQISSDFVKEEKGRKRDFFIFIVMNYMFLQVGHALIIGFKFVWDCVQCERLGIVPKEALVVFTFLTSLGVSLFTHGVGGRMFNEKWTFFHPFEGGTMHIGSQAMGWSLLGVSILLHILFLVADMQSEYDFLLYIGSATSWFAEGLILYSLWNYQHARKSPERVDHVAPIGTDNRHTGWLLFSYFQDLVATNMHWAYPVVFILSMLGLPNHFLKLSALESIARGCYLLFLCCLPAICIPFSPKRKKYKWFHVLGQFNAAFEHFLLHPKGIYFDSRMKHEGDHEDYTKDKAMFAMMPHGVVPFNVWAIFYHFEEVFGDVCLFFGSQISIVPIYRFFCGMRGGCMPVEKKRLIQIMETKQNVALMPGGVSEMMWCVPRSKAINVSIKHKGFVRVAIQQGYDLVPVFLFHSNDHYDNPFRDIQQWTYDKIGVPIGIPWFVNRWRFPVSNRNPVRVAIGKRLKVKQKQSPSLGEVDELHRLFYEEVARIFNQYKDEFGYGDRTLTYVV